MKHKLVLNKCYGGFKLSDEAVLWLHDKYNLEYHKSRFSGLYLDEELERYDERLIDCVETLKEKANGIYSNLYIVEIEGNKFYINEYDGLEEVVTPDSSLFEEIPE